MGLHGELNGLRHVNCLEQWLAPLRRCLLSKCISGCPLGPVSSMCPGSPDPGKLFMSRRDRARYKPLPCPCGQGRKGQGPKVAGEGLGSVGEGAGHASLEPSLKGTARESV